MKREFLLEFRVGDLPLPKEVIDAIMAENGRDIQKVKANFADYEDVKEELAKLRKDQSFEEMAAAWEEKYHRAMEEHRKELAQMEFDRELHLGIQNAQGRNAKAITALLDVESLKESENQTDAIARALENLKRDCRYLFGGDVPPPYARGTGAYNGAQEKHPTTLAGALREKFERK